MKVIKLIEEDGWEGDLYECPNCGEDRLREDFEYCPMCGIMLEWP